MTAFQRDKARASGSKRELSGSTVVYTLILEQGSIITNPSTWPRCLRRKRTRYRRCLEVFRYDWLDDVVSAVSVLSPKPTLNDIMTSTVLLPVRSAAPPIRNSGLARYEGGGKRVIAEEEGHMGANWTTYFCESQRRAYSVSEIELPAGVFDHVHREALYRLQDVSKGWSAALTSEMMSM
jgi:hypothetical protein